MGYSKKKKSEEQNYRQKNLLTVLCMNVSKGHLSFVTVKVRSPYFSLIVIFSPGPSSHGNFSIAAPKFLSTTIQLHVLKKLLT